MSTREATRTSERGVAAGGRFGAIDYLKAAALLGVVANHCLIPMRFAHRTALDDVVRWAVQFHVPAFLLISGFLYWSAKPMGARTLGRRLARVLIPYAIATAVMHVTGWVNVRTLWGAWMRLVTGSTLPIYYYVFVIATAILVSWFASRLPRPGYYLLCACAFAYALVVAVSPEVSPVRGTRWFWVDPFTFHVYFFAGALIAMHRDTLMALGRSHGRAVIVSCMAVMAVYAGLHWGVSEWAQANRNWIRMGYVAAATTWIVSLMAGRTPGRITRHLSDSGYTIFLYHYPLTKLVAPYVADWAPVLRIGAKFSIALVATTLLVVLSRAILGKRSRVLMGTA